MNFKSRVWKIVFCVFFVGIIIVGVYKGATRVKADEVGMSYNKQIIKDLLGAGQFSTSDNGVTLRKDDTADGVLISGPYSNISNSKFTFTNEFDFDQKSPAWIIVDGLAEIRKDIVLQFYLDNSTESFASVKLQRQKKEYNWKAQKIVTATIPGSGITGKHKISFRVVAGSDTSVTFLLRYIEFVQNDLPVVNLNLDESKGLIDAMNNDPEHLTECYGDMTLQIPDGYKSEYSDKTFSTGTYPLEYIRGRGNSTWMVDKKPYKMKLQSKADLLGMGKSKHWVLLANYYDVSLLRNKMTYWVGNALGMEFTPQSVFVNVVMNGKYLGSYYLCEQVRVGSSVVDIDDLEKDDTTKAATDEPTISGGYLLGMCSYGDEDGLSFSTTRDNTYEIESPSFDGYTNQAQYNYIKNYVQKTEDAIYGKGFKDSTGKSYADYMDVNSAIDYYWMQEVSMNGDGFLSTSTYLYKKRDGKLYWGPLWDFDYVAWGATEFDGNQTSGFTQNQKTWFAQLLQDDTFYNKLKSRWPAIKEKLLEAAKDGGKIDQYANQLDISQKYNYDIWNKFTNYGEDMSNVTYYSEVSRLKSWIKARVAWIDANINKVRPAMYRVVFQVDNKDYKDYSVEANSTLDQLPNEPTKKGYYFKGWYTKGKINNKEYEYPITSSITVNSNMTIYAKWMKESEVIKATKISFTAQDIYVPTLGMVVLKLGTKPFDGYIGKVKWSCSDSSIVELYDNNGVVYTGDKTGVVTIKATTSTGLVATCKIHVISNMVDKITSFSTPKTTTINIGEYKKIELSKTPGTKALGIFSYASQDPSIVAVNEIGELYAKKVGTTNICIYNADSNTMKFCKVSVKATQFEKSGLKYQVISLGKVNYAKCIGSTGKKIELKVPGTVTNKNVSYQVNSISDKAFKNNAYVKKIVLGANISSIGNEAFAGCKNLTLIKVESSVLTKVGKSAIKGANKKVKIEAPKNKQAAYKKLFLNAK